MITHVAIRFNGKVFALSKPKRHNDLFDEYPELRTKSVGGLLVTRDGQEQGFLVDGHEPDARFVSRMEGGLYAVMVGQVKKLSHPPDLYSEDLW